MPKIHVSVSYVVHGLALAVTGVSLLTPMIPADYKPLMAAIGTLVQAIIGILAAHSPAPGQQ